MSFINNLLLVKNFNIKVITILETYNEMWYNPPNRRIILLKECLRQFI